MEIYRTNWNEHIAAIFSHVYSRAPLWVTIQNTEHRLQAMQDIATLVKKQWQLTKALAEMNNILNPWRKEPEQSSNTHIENNEE